MRQRTLVLVAGLAVGVLVPAAGRSQEPVDTLGGDAAQLEAPPPDRLAQDATATGELRALFSRIDRLRLVEVTVDGGVARLTGSAPSQEAGQTALELARARDDVLFVEDQIDVEASLTVRSRAVLSELRSQSLEWLARAPLLLAALLIIGVFWVLGRTLSSWRWLQTHLGGTVFAADLARRAIRFVFGVTGLVLALEFLDATRLVGAVIGAAGVAGLAFGFAFRNIAENWLASILLSIRRPFDLDDTVSIGGNEGRVVRLTHSDTVLMTPAGNHLRIPNAVVFNGTVENFTRNPRRMIQVRLSMPRDTEVDRARTVLLESLLRPPALDEPEPSVLLVEVGDSHLTLSLNVWIDQRVTGFPKARSIVYKVAKEALATAGITGPISEHTLHMPDPAGGDVSAEPGVGRSKSASADLPLPTAEVADAEDALTPQLSEDRERSDEKNLLEPQKP